jgi:hypothetical protein
VLFDTNWRATNVLSVSEVNEQNRNHMKRISDSLFKIFEKIALDLLVIVLASFSVCLECFKTS